MTLTVLVLVVVALYGAAGLTVVAVAGCRYRAAIRGFHRDMALRHGAGDAHTRIALAVALALAGWPLIVWPGLAAWLWDHFPGGRGAQNAFWDACPGIAIQLEGLANRRDPQLRRHTLDTLGEGTIYP